MHNLKDDMVSIDVFLHIAKTAGTSFNTLLTREYGRDHSVHIPADQLDDGSRYIRTQKILKSHNIRLIRGHITHGIHKSIDRPVRYFTILREPASRIISELNHMASEAELQANDDSPWYQAVREWVDAESYFELRPRSLDNPMTRAISGISFEPGQCSESILQTAIQNLNQMAAFGIFESLYESIILLRRELGWSVVPVISHQKSGNPKHIKFSQHDHRFFKNLNIYDQRLYNHATEKFFKSARSIPGLRLKAYALRQSVPIATHAERIVRHVRTF